MVHGRVHRVVATALVLIVAVAGLSACQVVINGCVFEPTPYVPDPPPLTYTPECPGANLSGAELDRISLIVPILPDADLDGASMRHAYVLGGLWGGADFTGADLTGTQLVEVELPSVDFTDAVLTDVVLMAAWITDSDFSGTPVVPADVSVAADVGQTGAVVHWPEPTPIFGGAATPGDCDHASGATFPIGTTLVTCAVDIADGSGNFGTFTVTVLPPA
jgi:hypothetical protein